MTLTFEMLPYKPKQASFEKNKTNYSPQLSPLEIEGVIRKHPGVMDVAVTSVPHSEWGDLPVAFVVPRPGAEPSAEEIKDLVKGKL